MPKPEKQTVETAGQPDTDLSPETPTEEAKEPPQILLKVTASIAGARTKDGKPHKAKRYYPWALPATFAADPTGTLADIRQRVAKAHQAGTISGITTDGEIIADEPFNYDGVGMVAKGQENVGLTAERQFVFQGKGTTLAMQQQMQNLLWDKYGDPSKVKKNGVSEESEENI